MRCLQGVGHFIELGGYTDSPMRFISYPVLLIALLLVGGRVLGQSSIPSPARQVAAADRLFRAGSAAFTAGDLTAAHSDFAQVVRLLPRIAAAHAAFGAVLMAEGHLPEARSELTEACRLDPRDTNTALNLARVLAQTGEDRQAITLFRESDSDNLSAVEAFTFAGALQRTGEPEQARQLLETAVAREPRNAALHDALGSVLAQTGATESARTQFLQAIGLDPQFASAHAHLGSLLLLAHELAAALAELQTAERLGETAPEFRVELGRAFTAAGREQEAIATLRSVTTAASPVHAKYALALALQAAGDSKQAIPFFAEVAAAEPRSPDVLENYGLALVQNGDAKAALALYKRAYEAGDRSALLRENTGAAYVQANDLDHALAEFRAGLRLEPQNAQLHYNLGLTYKLQDKLEPSLAELREAQQLDSQLPDPPYTIGIILMQQGKAAEAAQALDRAVALRPENADAWSLLGNVEKDAGEPEKALVALRRAISLSPEQPSPHITLAAILAANGDTAGALSERKQAATLNRTAVNRQRAGFALDSGRALLAKGELSQAAIQLQTAITAEPDTWEAHLLLAEALKQQGKLTEAAAERHVGEELRDAAEKTSRP